MVLGDIAEEALQPSLILSDGSLLTFLRRPIVTFFMATAFPLFFLPALHPLHTRIRRRLPPRKA